MRVIDVFQNLPVISKEFSTFLASPQRFVRNRKISWDQPVPATQILAWCIAVTILFTGFYGITFGSLFENFSKSLPVLYPASNTQKIQVTTNKDTIEIKGLTWSFGFGIGVFFPELPTKKDSVPQLAIFRCGAVSVLLKNVVPSQLWSGPLPLLLQSLYAVVTVICLHAPARLMGGKGSIRNALNLTVIYISYTVLFATILAISAAITFLHIVSFTNWKLYGAWTVFVLIPVVVVFIRGFFACFCKFYEISKCRLFIAFLGSTVLSAGVSPLVFVPALFIILRFQPLLDVLF